MDFILLSSLLSITWWLNFKSVSPSVSVSFFLFFVFKLGVECANQCRQKCQQPTRQLFWNHNKPVQESSHLNTNTFNRTGKKSKMKPIKAALRTSQIFGSMSSSGCVSVMIHLLYVFSNWLLANLSDTVTGFSLMCKRLGELRKDHLLLCSFYPFLPLLLHSNSMFWCSCCVWKTQTITHKLLFIIFFLLCFIWNDLHRIFFSGNLHVPKSEILVSVSK